MGLPHEDEAQTRITAQYPQPVHSKASNAVKETLDKRAAPAVLADSARCTRKMQNLYSARPSNTCLGHSAVWTLANRGDISANTPAEISRKRAIAAPRLQASSYQTDPQTLGPFQSRFRSRTDAGKPQPHSVSQLRTDQESQHAAVPRGKKGARRKAAGKHKE